MVKTCSYHKLVESKPIYREYNNRWIWRSDFLICWSAINGLMLRKFRCFFHFQCMSVIDVIDTNRIRLCNGLGIKMRLTPRKIGFKAKQIVKFELFFRSILMKILGKWNNSNSPKFYWKDQWFSKIGGKLRSESSRIFHKNNRKPSHKSRKLVQLITHQKAKKSVINWLEFQWILTTHCQKKVLRSR